MTKEEKKEAHREVIGKRLRYHAYLHLLARIKFMPGRGAEKLSIEEACQIIILGFKR